VWTRVEGGGVGVAAGWFRDARLRWNPKTLVLDVATNALDVDCSIVCGRVGVDERGDGVDVQDSGRGGGWEKTRFLVVSCD
jgi:hypothetical protein